MKHNVHVFPDLAAASEALAEFIRKSADEAVKKNGYFALALSGGRTPKLLYKVLAEDYRNRVAWDKVHLFQVDERFVQPDDPSSNTSLIYNYLVTPLGLPSEHVHTIPVTGTPQYSARLYEQALREYYWEHVVRHSRRKTLFHFTLLGMGRDGHTASLFPTSTALGEKRRWVINTEAPPGIEPQKRITLTILGLIRSDFIAVLVSGDEKHGVVKHILREHNVATGCRGKLPIEYLMKRHDTAWFLDQAAWGSL